MAEQSKPKKLKIRFIKSPTGHFGLAYSEGEVTDALDVKKAKDLVELNYAELVK